MGGISRRSFLKSLVVGAVGASAAVAVPTFIIPKAAKLYHGSNRTRVHKPKKVLVTFNGKEINGYARNEIIEITSGKGIDMSDPWAFKTDANYIDLLADERGLCRITDETDGSLLRRYEESFKPYSRGTLTGNPFDQMRLIDSIERDIEYGVLNEGSKTIQEVVGDVLDKYEINKLIDHSKVTIGIDKSISFNTTMIGNIHPVEISGIVNFNSENS